MDMIPSSFSEVQQLCQSRIQKLQKYNVCIENGKYPAAMMVKELCSHALDGHRWVYQDSPVMAISEEEAERYDATLEPMEKMPARRNFIF